MILGTIGNDINVLIVPHGNRCIVPHNDADFLQVIKNSLKLQAFDRGSQLSEAKSARITGKDSYFVGVADGIPQKGSFDQ